MAGRRTRTTATVKSWTAFAIDLHTSGLRAISTKLLARNGKMMYIEKDTAIPFQHYICLTTDIDGNILKTELVMIVSTQPNAFTGLEKKGHEKDKV
jgi:hypothetical protein